MKTIDAKTVQEKLENGEQLNLIDVREAEEVAAGKIPGALHMPLGLVEFREHELDKNAAYIMVCRLVGVVAKRRSTLNRKVLTSPI